jgi:adenylyltransferase/sulfurtransferase
MADPGSSRYSRQILFTGIGESGQQLISTSQAVVVGCGALGSLQAAALARAGVGRLRLVDRDHVERSNLHRQWLFTESHAREGLPKAVAAARELGRANSEIEIQPAVADLTPATVEDLLDGADLILDGTDNFETRYLINDYAVREAIPWVYGGAVASYGLTMPVIPGRTCCLMCVYPEPPTGAQPTCETAGVLNAVTAAVAAIQAGDGLKILAGKADEVATRITTIDVWSGEIRQVRQPDPVRDCPCCGRREFTHLSGRGG